MAVNGVLITMAALALAGGAAASPAGTGIGHNPHHFTLKIVLADPLKGNWSTGTVFTISACPQTRCFHMSGPLRLPNNEGGRAEGSFSIREADCELHFLEVPRDGMDSGDFRVTLIASDQAGKGCGYLPAGLAGLYRQSP